MSKALALICFALTMAVAPPAQAADADEGAKLARRVCAICHAISSGKSSPNADAPPFSRIARSPKFRARGAAFVLDMHPRMPSFAFTIEQAEDVAAYIKTLARRK